MKQYIPHLNILLAGSLWGLIGLFNRGLTAGGLSSASIVVVRNLGGLVLMAVLFGLFDREVLAVKFRHLPWFFGTGVVSVLLFTLCYFRCQQLCSLAVAATLLYTAPAFVVVLSAILWRDPITPRKALALGVAFLGCVLTSGVVGGDLAISPASLLLGLGSGFFYGMYSIFGRFALKHYQPLTVTFYTFVFAGLGSLAVLRPAELAAAAGRPAMLLLALGLVVVSTVLPYIFYTRGLARVDSGRAAILASVEPVVAALVGVLAFHEPMTPGTGLGLACICVTVYLLR